MDRRKTDPAAARKTRAAKRQAERREWYAAHLICVNCGQADAEPGRTRCEKCREALRQSLKRRDPDGELHKVFIQGLRDSRKAAGLCIDCGRPTGGDMVRCPACNRKHRESNRICSMRKRMRRETENERRMLLERNTRP